MVTQCKVMQKPKPSSHKDPINNKDHINNRHCVSEKCVLWNCCGNAKSSHSYFSGGIWCVSVDIGRMGRDCMFSSFTTSEKRLWASLVVLAHMDLYLLPESSRWNRWCAGWCWSYRMFCTSKAASGVNGTHLLKRNSDNLPHCSEHSLECLLINLSAAGKTHYESIG